MKRRLKFLQIGAGLICISSLFALRAAAAESITIRAIFLPATWGTVVKETLAPQYERETGVKVEVQLIAREASGRS